MDKLRLLHDDVKLALMFLAAGLVATILEPEWRTFSRCIQTILIAFMIGYTSAPLYQHGLGVSDQLASGCATITALFSRHLLVGLFSMARRFASDPGGFIEWLLKVWRRNHP